MDRELERKLLVLEPSLRLRAKPVEREMYIWFVVDTSGSMFGHIGESLNIDLSMAVELAISSRPLAVGGDSTQVRHRERLLRVLLGQG
jgi:hypothetical protein